MRLRNIPGSREIIASSDYVIHENVMRDKKGCWADVFGNDAPLFLEIGMGKGRFISELAQREPCHNFVGIEKYSSVLLRAIQRREALEQKTHLTNLLYLRMEAEDLTDVFGPGEVAGIYLNFSDPWPKDRHAHRRLPSRAFLARYSRVLRPDGLVRFKTDNDDLFAFALDEAKEAGWKILAQTWDLHSDPVLSEGNIMTEYEERFSAAGHPIHEVILAQPDRG
ncbi:MAG: tRNA (guanosine(46)-N7)-methyltransferase TrmB [Lachnospiraceae bacterium]|nr:tRNA (guanosine(46)-N7)-methyltransferase TrmB [Lachnospiraceae bacterium]